MNHYRPLPAPAALAVYEPRRPGDSHGYWRVRCPYCGREHRHAAFTADRPLPALPHCGGGPAYRLVPTDPTPTA